MTISGIGSTTSSYPTSAADNFNQVFGDFKNIGTAIQSGDSATAQKALTAFQNDLQSGGSSNPLSQLFSSDSTLGKDLTALQTALKSNDSTGAQAAFKTLVQDMKGAMKIQAPRHHHHHRVDNDDQNSNAATSTSSVTDPTTSALSASGTLDVQA